MDKKNKARMEDMITSMSESKALTKERLRNFGEFCYHVGRGDGIEEGTRIALKVAKKFKFRYKT